MRTVILASLMMVTVPTLQAFDNDSLKRRVIEKVESIRYRLSTSYVPQETLWDTYEKLEGIEKNLLREQDPEFFCKPKNSWHYTVARFHDGQEVGSGNVSLEDCQAAIRGIRNSMICAPESGFHSRIYKIRDLQPLGERVMNDTCNETLSRSTRHFVCAPSNGFHAHLTRVNDGERQGGPIMFDDCYALIPTLPGSLSDSRTTP